MNRVVTFQGRIWVRRTCCLGLVFCLVGLLSAPAMGQEDPSIFGEWAEPPNGQPDNDPNDGGDYGWEVIAKDAILLSTGKVLVWDRPGTSAKLWNPADGSFTDVRADFAPPDIPFLHCAGHAFLGDGSLLAAGGGISSSDARDEVSIFRLSALDPWEQAQVMNHARWYPTCTTLPDGRVLAVAGKDDNGALVGTPEIYDPANGQWTDLHVTTTGMASAYPFMFLLPDGKIFNAGGGSGSSTYRLDVATPTWESYPANNNSIFGGRKGAAVMYEPWKILKCGGQFDNAAPIEQRTAMIDLSEQPTPVWRTETAWDLPLVPRKDHNLVLLPDGKILLVGGFDGTNFIKDARMWDPNAPEPVWVNMADMVKPRGHHSVGVLLPDARVLAAGGCPECENPDPATAEMYKPPYFFTGTPRPKIGFAPSAVNYNTQFQVILAKVPGLTTADIAKVTLVRPASTTHWFDSDQRFLKLSVTLQTLDTMLVTAPTNGNEAPPGYYMLFVVTNAGVPSKAAWIRLDPGLS